MSERLLRVSDVAQLTAVQPATVQRWVELGKLPAYRLGGAKGGRLRIPESALQSFLEAGSTVSDTSHGPEAVA
jgi:excisionase family DNA binding protein